MNNTDKQFFDELASLCKKYGALLIAEGNADAPGVLTHGRGSEGEEVTSGYSLKIGPNGDYKVEARAL